MLWKALTKLTRCEIVFRQRRIMGFNSNNSSKKIELPVHCLQHCIRRGPSSIISRMHQVGLWIRQTVHHIFFSTGWTALKLFFRARYWICHWTMVYSVDSIFIFAAFAIAYFFQNFSPIWLFCWRRGFQAFCMGAFLLILRRTGRPFLLSQSGGNMWCWTSDLRAHTHLRWLHCYEALRSAEIMDWPHTSTAASHWCIVEWRSITIRHINSATEPNFRENWGHFPCQSIHIVTHIESFRCHCVFAVWSRHCVAAIDLVPAWNLFAYFLGRFHYFSISIWYFLERKTKRHFVFWTYSDSLRFHYAWFIAEKLLKSSLPSMDMKLLRISRWSSKPTSDKTIHS